MSTTRIGKVLVANRGEIARRIARSCHTMGISTVAVFSDADADAPFVREADEAVRIGPAPSAESYLHIDRMVAAAARTGADAVHPGYGFLAENARFAEACERAGLLFIGPPADVIRTMGSKQASKRIAEQAGIPVVPGYGGDDQAPDRLAAEAIALGFPVLIKASAGGGGKGMVVVRSEAELAQSIASATRVAQSAFGDPTLLIEKYIERPRHIEVQVLGDSHGNVVHLFERECSIQRRHQKILEESPSPDLTDTRREQIGAAAVDLAKAIGYQNAGTVELIVAPDGAFYFLEVNTRLQVEHPVTECVTGLDLVREQIRIARGESLGYGQSDLCMEGAAVEVRLYAEDPTNGFLPASGRIVDWHPPSGEGVRVDSGVETGSEVSIHYDPMLAKIITWAPTRSEALAKMARALRTTAVSGVPTNRELLLELVEHPELVAGYLHTHFIDEHFGAGFARGASPELTRTACIAATLLGHELRRRALPAPHVPAGYRNSHFEDQWVELDGPDGLVRVEYRRRADAITVRVGDRTTEIRRVELDGPRLSFEAEGIRRQVRVVRDGPSYYVGCAEGAITLVERPRYPEPESESLAAGCVAPMPGRVVRLFVGAGDQVEAGQVLVVLEAMKMEHSIVAPHEGSVSELRVAEGDQVEADQLLFVMESELTPR